MTNGENARLIPGSAKKESRKQDCAEESGTYIPVSPHKTPTAELALSGSGTSSNRGEIGA
jgi:hypothetical protein